MLELEKDASLQGMWLLDELLQLQQTLEATCTSVGGSAVALSQLQNLMSAEIGDIPEVCVYSCC